MNRKMNSLLPDHLKCLTSPVYRRAKSSSSVKPVLKPTLKPALKMTCRLAPSKYGMI